MVGGTLAMRELEDWTTVEAFYWAVVTMSTVGLGGECPTTEEARLFAAVFMLLGVGGTGKLLADIAAWPLQRYRARLEERVLNQYGEELDEAELWELAAGREMRDNGLCASPNYVTKNEFCLGMLIWMEKIAAADLRLCQAAFDRLDIDGSGRLDLFNIHANQLRQRELVRQRFLSAARSAAQTSAHGSCESRECSLLRLWRPAPASQPTELSLPPPQVSSDQIPAGSAEDCRQSGTVASA